MELFGTELQLRKCYCALNNNPASPIEKDYINLYVRFDGCQANCKFCTYKRTNNGFNVGKYKLIVEELKHKDIEIRKISFTGGEPTLNWELFADVVGYTMRSFDTFYVLSTNGFSNVSPYFVFDSIALSRHHYNTEIHHNEILGVSYTIPDEELMKYRNLHLSCNLIKGYIDSASEIEKYLQWAASLSIQDIGFVGLMPTNEYAQTHRVDFDDNIKNLMCVKEWKDREFCRCKNYTYFDENTGRILGVYHRQVFAPNCFENMLSFDGQNLRVGYTGRVIY